MSMCMTVAMAIGLSLNRVHVHHKCLGDGKRLADPRRLDDEVVVVFLGIPEGESRERVAEAAADDEDASVAIEYVPSRGECSLGDG